MAKIERGSIWTSRRGYKFLVINILKHADDCTSEFVYFTNLEDTFDTPAGEKWVLGTDVFAKRFKPVKTKEPKTPTDENFINLLVDLGLYDVDGTSFVGRK